MRRFRSALFIISFVVIVYSVVHIVTVQRVNDGVFQALRPYTGSDEHIDVHVSSFPVFRLFSGQVDTLTIHLARPRIGETYLQSFTAEGTNVFFDLEKLQQGELAVRRAERLVMSARLGEDELNAIVQHALPEVDDVQVHLKSGAVALEGTVALLGQHVDVAVEGEIVITNRTALRFIPTDIIVEQQRLPSALVDMLRHMVQWSLDVTHFPFPVQIDHVRVHQGEIELTGSWNGSS